MKKNMTGNEYYEKYPFFDDLARDELRSSEWYSDNILYGQILSEHANEELTDAQLVLLKNLTGRWGARGHDERFCIDLGVTISELSLEHFAHLLYGGVIQVGIHRLFIKDLNLVGEKNIMQKVLKDRDDDRWDDYHIRCRKVMEII